MRITHLMALTLAVVPATPASAQRSLVAIFAHPDDERIVAPILARYAREGNSVYLVVATDGAKGITAHAKIPARRFAGRNPCGGNALRDARAWHQAADPARSS